MRLRPALRLRGTAALSGLVLTLLSTALAQTPASSPEPLEALVAAHPAFGPALAYESLASSQHREALRVARVDLEGAALQPNVSLRWRPSIRWSGRELDDITAAKPDWAAPVTLALSLRHDPSALARAQRNLQRAEVDLLQRLHRDLRNALGAHIALERAIIAERLASEAALDAAATLARAEGAAIGTAPNAGALEPTTLSASRLALERSEAALARANRALSEAEREAVGYGFNPSRAAGVQLSTTLQGGGLPLEGWRLALPAADPQATPAVARATLELAIAEADAARVRFATPLRDIRLEANRTTSELRTRGTLRLDEGRPSAAVEFDLQSATRPSWGLTLSASLELSRGAAEGLRRADAARSSAAAELEALQSEAPWSLERSRRNALDAEEDVAFSERSLGLARRNLLDALERLSGARRDPNSGSNLQEAAAQRALIAFLRESDAFYRTWERYLLEAERYWNEAGVLGGVLAPLPGGR